MSNEQLFFGLSQALRKFPKETGKFAATAIVKCKESVRKKSELKIQVRILYIIVFPCFLFRQSTLSLLLQAKESYK